MLGQPQLLLDCQCFAQVRFRLCRPVLAQAQAAIQAAPSPSPSDDNGGGEGGGDDGDNG